jgi:hypothetical protein
MRTKRKNLAGGGTTIPSKFFRKPTQQKPRKNALFVPREIISFSSRAPVPVQVPGPEIRNRNYIPRTTQYWRQLSFDWNYVVHSIETNEIHRRTTPNANSDHTSTSSNNSDGYSVSTTSVEIEATNSAAKEGDDSSRIKDSNESRDANKESSDLTYEYSDGSNESTDDTEEFTADSDDEMIESGNLFGSPYECMAKIRKFQSCQGLLTRKRVFKAYTKSILDEICLEKDKNGYNNTINDQQANSGKGSISMDESAYTLLQFASEALLVDLFAAANVHRFQNENSVTVNAHSLNVMVKKYEDRGHICPFPCTLHRREAQQTSVEIMRTTLLQLPIVLVDMVAEYLINATTT